MHLGRIARVLAFAAFAVVARAGVAKGDPSSAELQQAREMFAMAEKDERAGEWSLALDKLRRVAQVKTTPGIRFHIALCEEKTGQPAAALEDYARAKKQAEDEKNDEVLAALKEPLAALRARIPRLKVHVPTGVSGLEIALDGRVFAPGSYEADIPVDPRTHTLTAKAPGHKPFTKTVFTPERAVTPVVVVLDPDASEPALSQSPAPSAPTPPSPAPPPSEPEPTAATKPSPPPSAPPPPSGSGGGRTGAILATAGAGALALAGVGAFFVADGLQSDARAQCATRVNCDDLRQPVHTWDAVTLGAWLTGGALAAVAIVLWSTPTGAKHATEARARAFVGPGAVGLGGAF